jgi:hypothetical protein
MLNAVKSLNPTYALPLARHDSNRCGEAVATCVAAARRDDQVPPKESSISACSPRTRSFVPAK